MVKKKTIVGVVLVLVGCLLVSVVFLDGSGTPEPETVNTSAEGDELVVETFTRLESSDYEFTISYNDNESEAYHVEYYAISHSEREGLVGLCFDDELTLLSYVNDVGSWRSAAQGEGKWEFDSPHNWSSKESGYPMSPQKFYGANASVVERTDEVIVAEIADPERLGLQLEESVFRPNSTHWVLRIDANSGDLQKINASYDAENGSKLAYISYDFEYGITIERPENIPFSLEEQYYRFLAMDLYEQLGLIGGSVLILVGCGVLYREYPLHRRLFRGWNRAKSKYGLSRTRIRGVGVAAVVLGMLAISAVVVTAGPDTQDPPAVNTSAAAEELLDQSIDRLKYSDYAVTNKYSEGGQIVHNQRYEISNSNLRLRKGQLSGSDFSPDWFETRHGDWHKEDGKWEYDDYQSADWKPGAEGPFDHTEIEDRSVVERSDSEIVVRGEDNITEPHRMNVSERILIDAKTGDLREWEITSDTPGVELMVWRYEYEYGITVERPEDIPFSFEEQRTKFDNMDAPSKAVLVVGTLLILVGCGVLYRVYPLHRELI